MNLNPLIIKSLTECLKNTEVNKIEFHNCNLGNKISIDLIKGLVETSVTKLSLRFNNLNDDLCEFGKELSKTQVATLDLSYNDQISLHGNWMLAIGIINSNLTKVIGLKGLNSKQQELTDYLKENSKQKSNQLIAIGQAFAKSNAPYCVIFNVISFLHHGLVAETYNQGNAAAELAVNSKVKAIKKRNEFNYQLGSVLSGKTNYLTFELQAFKLAQQEFMKKEASALKIQALCRGYNERKKMHLSKNISM